MTRTRSARRLALVLAAAVGLALAAPMGADAATYPPATTGTFAVTAHSGANPVTVDGLGADLPATALITGSGPAPVLGVLTAGAARPASTANLAVGRTDDGGSVDFTLTFGTDAAGVYNISVSTADGHSVSGSITVPSRDGSPLAWSGTNIALWVMWLAGILLIVGVIALAISAARRRSGR